MDWKGCGTALITPFDERGRIDFGALERFVNWQIERGIDFLVPCGTTGESATLSGDERKAVTAAVVKTTAGRVPVIAGAGGNHTAKAVFWARDAAEVGADGILSVSPMYNKPGPEGLFRHYSALSEATELPILRPLVGMDKDEITAEAERIGTYPISIIPDQDCCTLFTPRHPSTSVRLKEALEAEQSLAIESQLDAAIAAALIEDFKGDYARSGASPSGS